MKKTVRLFLCFVGMLFLFSGLSAKTTDPLSSDAEKQRLRAKADYIFLEASNALSQERYDDYYALLRRAHALNPDDPYILGDLAELNLLSSLTDSVGTIEAYNAIKNRYFASPGDYFLASVYARIATKLNNLDDLVELWSTLGSYHPERSDVSMYLASSLLIKSILGDSSAFNEAMTIYNRLLEGLPGDVGLTSHKIRAYSSRKDSAAIKRELQNLLIEAPENLSAILYASDIYSNLGENDSAIKYLDKALALEPENGEVYLHRAEFFDKIGDTIGYDREVFNALGANDLDFEPKLDILYDYVKELFDDPENRTRIDGMFQRLLELNPGESRLHALYGAFEETQNNTDGAIEQYSYSLDLDPMQSDIWMGYLRMLSQKEDKELLLENSLHAAKLFPDNLAFPMTAAGLMMIEDKKDKAMEILDSIHPDALTDPYTASNYYATRGDLYEALGKRDSAYSEYTRAIELNPHNAMAMNNMAYFMALDSIKLDVANAYASMAVSEDPENPTFLDTYAWVEFRRRNFENAKNLIDKALYFYALPIIEVADSEDSIPPTLTDTISGDPIEEFVEEEIHEYLEPSAEIYDHAGDIYFWNGLYSEAVVFWEKAAALEPENEKIKKKAKHKTYFP